MHRRQQSEMDVGGDARWGRCVVYGVRANNETEVCGKAVNRDSGGQMQSRRAVSQTAEASSLFACLFICLIFLLFPEKMMVAQAASLGTASSVQMEADGGSSGGGINLSLSYGFQNIAKSGQALPIDVKVENGRAEALSGRLVVEVPAAGKKLHYTYPVSVGAGQTAEVRGSVTVAEQESRLQLRLEDEAGKPLAERSVAVTIQGSGSELLIGLLSNHPEELSYFRGLTVGAVGLKTRTVTLSPGDIPVTEGGLDQLDVIIISDFNMYRLSEAVTDAITAWVEGGGVLLLGTGRNGDQLGGFQKSLGSLSLGAFLEAPIDMGLKYSTNGPDGAVLTLPLRLMEAEQETELIQSGDIPVLTAVSVGSGVIGVAAYNFCDIREFSTQQLSYPADLLETIMGSVRLASIAAAEGEDGSSYEEVQNLLSLEDPGRVPNIALYLAAALGFLLVAGPGLYFALRRRGLALYYPVSVVLSAFVFAAVIWFIGYPLRFEGPFVEYAAIRTLSADGADEREYISLSSPSQRSIELTLPAGYSIQPIVAQKTEPAEDSLLHYNGETETGAEVIGIDYTGETLRLSAEELLPFSQQYFRLWKRETGDAQADASPAENAADETFALSLSVAGGRLSGTIKNQTSENLQAAALLLNGRIIPIGTIMAGEEIDLSGSRIVYGPTGSADFTAAFLTGLSQIPEGNANRASALSKTRLLSYFLRESSGYQAPVRLLGFLSEGAALPSMTESGVDSYGTTLVTAVQDAELWDGEEVWRSALLTEPKLVSGAYNASANTLSGTAALELEYSLGGDLAVSMLRFNNLSTEFDARQNEAGERLAAFRGAKAMYNYVTGSYDLLSSDQMSFTAETLAPYLSPSNTIMIRYIPDENTAEGTQMFLPVPTVRGTPKL